MVSVGINDFVRRQTYDSEFSYFMGTDRELIDTVAESFANAKPGYRDGVVLVPVNPLCFYSSVVQLKDGDELIGEFKARREGEQSTKNIRAAKGKRVPAVAVDIVLYHRDVLAENNEQTTDAEWEIISINARTTKKEMPISPGALMRNYFCEEGGTDTLMTPKEFVDALKVSREYWRDKVLLTARVKL